MRSSKPLSCLLQSYLKNWLWDYQSPFPAYFEASRRVGREIFLESFFFLLWIYGCWVWPWYMYSSFPSALKLPELRHICLRRREFKKKEKASQMAWEARSAMWSQRAWLYMHQVSVSLESQWLHKWRWCRRLHLLSAGRLERNVQRKKIFAARVDMIRLFERVVLSNQEYCE